MRLGSIHSFTTLSVELAMVFVSAAAADRPTEDPELLLRRIRSRTAAHLSQLPNYACREVVDRTLRRGNTWNHLDTVQFEVAYVGREELFSRDYILTSDEAFFAGTGAEVTPLVEVDKRKIGDGRRGVLTTEIQKAFFDVVYGRDRSWNEWRTPV